MKTRSVQALPKPGLFTATCILKPKTVPFALKLWPHFILSLLPMKYIVYQNFHIIFILYGQ